MDSGDKILKNHFANAKKNATYRSKTTHELIICCTEVITKQIIYDFSSLPDEPTGYSNKEQMPLVIRYVDQSGFIKERFLKYILYSTRTSGQAFAEKIVDCIRMTLIKICKTVEGSVMMVQQKCHPNILAFLLTFKSRIKLYITHCFLLNL